MTVYDDTNRGVLFKNEKKSDKHHDYKGRIDVGGTAYWLSAWIKTDRNGKKYMSLSVSPKDDEGGQSQSGSKRRPTPADDEEPPF